MRRVKKMIYGLLFFCISLSASQEEKCEEQKVAFPSIPIARSVDRLSFASGLVFGTRNVRLQFPQGLEAKRNFEEQLKLEVDYYYKRALYACNIPKPKQYAAMQKMDKALSNITRSPFFISYIEFKLPLYSFVVVREMSRKGRRKFVKTLQKEMDFVFALLQKRGCRVIEPGMSADTNCKPFVIYTIIDE